MKRVSMDRDCQEALRRISEERKKKAEERARLVQQRLKVKQARQRSTYSTAALLLVVRS